MTWQLNDTTATATDTRRRWLRGFAAAVVITGGLSWAAGTVFGDELESASPVEATPEEAEETPEGAFVGLADGFGDLDDAWPEATSALRELNEDGVLHGTGCGDGLLCPAGAIRRWEMAVWLVRVLDDGDDPAGRREGQPQPMFGDVDPSLWWSVHVERLADLEITTGCRTDEFCPDDSVTRGQLATFLMRAFDLQPGTHDFVDAHDNTHHQGIAALATAGITNGCAVNPARYCPQDKVTRQQTAALLVRAIRYVDQRPETTSGCIGSACDYQWRGGSTGGSSRSSGSTGGTGGSTGGSGGSTGGSSSTPATTTTTTTATTTVPVPATTIPSLDAPMVMGSRGTPSGVWLSWEYLDPDAEFEVRHRLREPDILGRPSSWNTPQQVGPGERAVEVAQLEPGRFYQIQVRARKDGKVSEWADHPGEFVQVGIAPGPPVIESAVYPTQRRQFVVTWSPPYDPGSGATGYVVHYSYPAFDLSMPMNGDPCDDWNVRSGNVFQVDKDSMSRDFTLEPQYLVPGHRYCVMVSSTWAGGRSATAETIGVSVPDDHDTSPCYPPYHTTCVLPE